MGKRKVYKVIGLMSGTSLDGVDVTLVETDGYSVINPLRFETYSYDDKLKETVQKTFGQNVRDPEAEKLITDAHIKAVKDFGEQADLIGFHGQTIFHDPQNGVTLQIGDGQRLANETGIDVIYDFRSADVAAGGEGAPLIPLYHWGRAIAQKLLLPCVILNIGGISNVTYVSGESVLAFDTGPGNALINDFMMERLNKPYDEDGALAAKGAVELSVLEQYLADPYFERPVPKSLDRDYWDMSLVEHLNESYGATTLTALTAQSIAKALDHFPEKPREWYVAGGGRHNKAIIERLEKEVGTVKSVDELGWNGDAIEAEGFAYLAVRSLIGEPLSLPTTTGVPKPQRGGVLAKAGR